MKKILGALLVACAIVLVGTSISIGKYDVTEDFDFHMRDIRRVDNFDARAGRITSLTANSIVGTLGTFGTSLTIDTMTLSSGSITDTTGAIDFNNENLTTTGNITGTNIDATTSYIFSDDTTTNTAPVRTATLVVATSDSSVRSIAQADYVCPEDDALDYITTTVIPALPANGGSIVLLEGTYTVSTNDKPLEIDTKTNISIIGQGAGTELCLATGIGSDIIKVIDSSEILIENLFIDGTTTGAAKSGILFDNVDYSKVSKVWSLNNKDAGIYLSNGSDYNEIMHSEFKDNAGGGIYLDGSTTPNIKNLIVGNLCSGNYDGIYADAACNYNTFANNTIEGNSDCAIYLDDGPSYNAIIGNIVLDNYYGIYVDSDCNYNNIIGNMVYGTEDDGISMTGSSHTTISGNISQGNSYEGIDIADSSHITISGNTYQGNGENGIYIGSSSRITISGNTCQGNGKNGIYSYGSSHNNISGNTIYDNGKADAATYDGIHIRTNSDHNNVQTNLVRQEANGNTHRYGIRIDTDDCDANLIANNDCYDGGGTNGISDAGTATLFGAGNRNNDGTWSATPN